MDKTKEAFEVAKFIGVVGFGAGFIGPAIVSPGSNQGPLFGIIISGPLSFIYGLFVGFLPAMFPLFEKVDTTYLNLRVRLFALQRSWHT